MHVHICLIGHRLIRSSSANGVISNESARPGATEAGQCYGEKNPVWAREKS